MPLDVPREKSPLNDENYNWWASADIKYGANFVNKYEDFCRSNPRVNIGEWNDRITHYLRRWCDAGQNTVGDGEKMKIQMEINEEFPLMPKHYDKAIADIDRHLTEIGSSQNVYASANSHWAQGVMRHRSSLMKLDINNLPAPPATAIAYIEAMAHLQAMRKLLVEKRLELESEPTNLMRRYEYTITQLKVWVKNLEQSKSDLKDWETQVRNSPGFAVIREIQDVTGEERPLSYPIHLRDNLSKEQSEVGSQLKEICRLNQILFALLRERNIQPEKIKSIRLLQWCSEKRPPTIAQVEEAEDVLRDVEINFLTHGLLIEPTAGAADAKTGGDQDRQPINADEQILQPAEFARLASMTRSSVSKLKEPLTLALARQKRALSDGRKRPREETDAQVESKLKKAEPDRR